MAVRLLIGPVGSGKTTRALREFGRFTPLQQHESVRFVVPGVAYVLSLRQLLLSDASHRSHTTHMTHESLGILGDPFCTFQRLAEEMVAAQSITETQKRLLLEQLAMPEYFRPSPNLPAALSAIIRTLKRSVISPDGLSKAAVHLPQTSQPKTSALCEAYQSYEDALAERGLQDSESILWRALDYQAPWELVIVDGFTRFYPIHLEFIRRLADHSDVLVTSDKPIDLSHTTIESLPPKTQNPQPTTLASVDAVAPEIKRLLREGFALDEIAIVARDIRPYQQKIMQAFGEQGIWLATEVYPLKWEGEASAEQIRMESNQLRKDCAAWKAIRRITAELEAAEALLGRKHGPEALSSAIRRATFRVPNGSGVTLSDTNMLGGREFRAAFAITPAERQAYEDPFLLDFERELLNPHLPHPLELSAVQQDDFDPASCAAERLYAVAPESEGDVLPTIEEAETLAALRRRTILDCCTAEDEETRQTAADAYNLVLEKGELGSKDFEPVPADLRELLE